LWSARVEGHCLINVIWYIAVALTFAERCMDESDCSHITCDSSSTLACQIGECTCATGKI